MKYISIFAFSLLLCALSACASEPPPVQVVEVTTIVTQPIEITRIVEQTVVVTVPITVVVTATPAPATSTPTITPTPIFQRWNSADAIAAFQDAELECEEPRPMTDEDYGIAPQVAEEGTRFFLPSLCAGCGGRVFSFSNQQNLEILKTYYETISESSSAFFTWIFVHNNILVQINGDLPEERAREYEAALQALK